MYLAKFTQSVDCVRSPLTFKLARVNRCAGNIGKCELQHRHPIQSVRKRKAPTLPRIACGQDGQVRDAGLVKRARSHRDVAKMSRVKRAAEKQD